MSINNDKEERSSGDGYYISIPEEKKESLLDAKPGLCSDPHIGGYKIYDFFNGLLSENEVDRIKQHLVGCSPCQITLAKLGALYHLLKEKSDTLLTKSET